MIIFERIDIQMKKIVLGFIFIFCILSTVYAVDIDMDLDDNIYEVNEIVDSSDVSENTDNNIKTNTSAPKVSTTSTQEDFQLSISDIIDIILISVGIVIVFLAIAILIKIR